MSVLLPARRTTLAAAILIFSGVLLASVSEAEADTLYALHDYDDYRHLSGYIVTDGTIGTLAPSNIRSWSYQWDFFPASSSAQGTLSGTLLATSSGILVPAGGPSANVQFSSQPHPQPIIGQPPYLWYDSSVSYRAGSGVILWGQELIQEIDGPPYVDPPQAYWRVFSSANLTVPVTGEIVIASAVAVPEPSNLILLAVGAISLGGYVWRRYRVGMVKAA